MRTSFLVDNRFLVLPEKNMVIDESSGAETRLEQRILDVLCLLAETPRELVKRDEIVHRVWNDYGGADEGLTQAISLLRKVFDDKDKKLIETIPKKGYILNASVTEPAMVPTTNSENDTVVRQKAKRWLILVPVVIGVALIYFLLLRREPDVPANKSPDIEPVHEKVGADNVDAQTKRDTAAVTSPDVFVDTSKPRRS